MRTLFLIAATFAAIGCKEQAKDEPTAERYRASIEANVKARLRNPETAVFSETSLSLKAGVPALCGKVSASNGSGGMTAPQRFIGGGGVILESDIPPAAFTQAWTELC